MAGLVERFGSWLPHLITEGRVAPLPVPKHPDKGPYFLEAAFQISTMEPEAQSLFARLLESEEFDKGLEQLSPLLRRRRTDPSRKESEQHFVGFLFEHLSLYFVQTRLRRDQAVLSPSQTSRLYERFYPEEMIQRDRYGLSIGIKGVTVPDGILLEQRQGKTFITGVYEYSLVKLRARKQKQTEFYNSKTRVIEDFIPIVPNPFRKAIMGEYVHNVYPQFPARIDIDFEKFSTFFVFPKGESENTRVSGNNVYVVPFSRKEFGWFVDGVIEDVEKLRDGSRIST